MESIQADSTHLLEEESKVQKQPERALQSEEAEFRLLTLNLFMRPPPVNNNGNDWKNERMDYFGKNLLQDYDIFCAQEVFTMMNHRKQKLLEYAAACGQSYFSVGDRPPTFSWYLTDGGLATTSRFPIVERDFKPYKYGFASDSLSYKGLLYTKIIIQGHVLHLFQSHMQASYFGTDADSFVGSFDTRMTQFETCIQFIDKKTRHAGADDLILFAGDMNVNGDSKNPEAKSYTDMIKDNPEFEGFVDSIVNEYDLLMRVLEDEGKWTVVDHLQLANGGKHPTTYGDMIREEDGTLTPKETVLTDVADHGSLQSLDYIFELQRRTKLKRKPSEHELQKIESASENPEIDVESPNKQRKKLVVDTQKTKVQPFFVEGEPFTQISDHYGIETVLKIV